MYIHRWMDKEIVVRIYSGILLSHKKEWIWVSSSEVDETRACYTEWSKSEKEKQISYINTHIWCLNKWTERVTGNTYITICKTDSQWEFVVWLRKLKQGLCINLEGWDGEGDRREFQKGGDIMYTYGWFRLRFDRKQQNSAK